MNAAKVTQETCSACTGVIYPDPDKPGGYIVKECMKCSRAFGSIGLDYPTDEAMTPLESLAFRLSVEYYQPRLDLLVSSLNQVHREIRTTGRFSEPTPKRQLIVPEEKPCAGCSGYYQFHYCEGEPQSRAGLCFTCDLVFGSLFNPKQGQERRWRWYAKLIGRLFRSHYHPRALRIRNAMRALDPPGRSLTPLNEFGNRCACAYNCNVGREEEIEQDWRVRMSNWNVAYMKWDAWDTRAC